MIFPRKAPSFMDIQHTVALLFNYFVIYIYLSATVHICRLEDDVGNLALPPTREVLELKPRFSGLMEVILLAPPQF